MSNHNGGIGRILKYAGSRSTLTQEQLADRLHVSTSLVAKFETNRLIPRSDTARQLDAVFDSGDLFQGSVADVRAYAGGAAFIRPWLDDEQRATMIRSFELAVVPGLFQTEEYARAILGDAGTRVPDLDAAVAARIARAEVLHRAERPCRLFAVLDEAVLRRPVGGPQVMAGQLHAIVRACALPNVSVTVVPASVGGYPGLNGPLALATVDGRTVAFLDDPLDGRVVEDPDRVAALDEVWEAIREYALPARPSLELLTEAAESWS
ncbi:helix-turn-helix transcriptional regulator [Micromonospora sp. WMMD1102]|uniref:helix-turn-helix domain-containing protein n=1 Tax=Micromonospora sp. WMMD1102 TaxID=3016105 RepID=UPI0024157B47|nr:helix-turn-helix transcriptional regulator [Micromonospora sp. WMMD1102]MDG4786123.1 helix-turn-helix transcriptional regulator [Micromonospora sp. WMMD1102]